MRSTGLHIALAILILFQTVSASAWVNAVQQVVDAPMVSCHDTPEPPVAPERGHDCCDGMDSAACLLACASVTGAVSIPVLPDPVNPNVAEPVFHISLHASLQPSSIYRPPSTN